ncbi:hypothetical protein [Haloferax chudinovii]|uniref:Phosphatidate cytidylyltransferase n=1 Tax=Haloferax chudinovii TaxID=1109010 RepID=A0ABD5XA20_9EURY
MTNPQSRSPVERSLARTTLGVDLASAAALAVAAVVFRGPPAEVGDDVVVSVLLLGVACTGLLQLAARGGLSYPTKSAGTLVGLWLVGVSFDLGAGHLLMWVGVVAGGCVIATHAALVRAAR